MLDQTALVQRILAAPDRRSHTAPPLGAYRTFQVPIADIASTAGLTMPELVDADVLQLAGAARTSAQRATTGRIELSHHDDMVLT